MEELKAEISHCFGISQHTEPCRCPGFRGVPLQTAMPWLLMAPRGVTHIFSGGTAGE